MKLYYGDNLDVLRRHVADESVDLVYLDPPFNSNATYNVLFAERDGTQAASQIKAFEDTWRWDEGAARAFEEVVEAGGRVSQAMQAFRTFLGDTDMLAYLAMMAPRLVELRRVLKPTGKPLPALRSDREPLPQDAAGRGLRPGSISGTRSSGSGTARTVTRCATARFTMSSCSMVDRTRSRSIASLNRTIRPTLRNASGSQILTVAVGPSKT